MSCLSPLLTKCHTHFLWGDIKGACAEVHSSVGISAGNDNKHACKEKEATLDCMCHENTHTFHYTVRTL